MTRFTLHWQFFFPFSSTSDAKGTIKGHGLNHTPSVLLRVGSDDWMAKALILQTSELEEASGGDTSDRDNEE